MNSARMSMGTHFNFATTQYKSAVSFSGKRGIAWLVPVRALTTAFPHFSFWGAAQNNRTVIERSLVVCVLVFTRKQVLPLPAATNSTDN